MQKEPDINTMYSVGSSAPAMRSETFLGPAVGDIDIDGLDLETAADRLGVAIEDLWRRIRNGQIMARSERGKVFVYASAEAMKRQSPQVIGASRDHLPPLPTEEALPTQIILSRIQEPTSESSANAHLTTVSTQDIALLMDHLSLAKEENREIIRLTQDSMSRLTEMTDEMLNMKNEVISAREQQVEMLHERLRSQTDQLRAVLREKENLETLTRALSAQSQD